MDVLICNCQSEGFCPTFRIELWGRQFRVVHGLEGTEAEIAHYRLMLGAAEQVQNAPESQPVALAAPKRKGGCNCGGMAIARRVHEKRQQEELRKGK